MLLRMAAKPITEINIWHFFFKPSDTFLFVCRLSLGLRLNWKEMIEQINNSFKLNIKCGSTDWEDKINIKSNSIKYQNLQNTYRIIF